MSDTLEEIFRLQKEYVSTCTFERYPKSLEERISALCTAIIHEAVELQDLGRLLECHPPSFNRGNITLSDT